MRNKTKLFSFIKSIIFGDTISTLPKNYWNRAGAVLSPKTAGDSLNMGAGTITGADITDTSLTASKFVATDANKKLISLNPDYSANIRWNVTKLQAKDSNGDWQNIPTI